MQHESAVAAVSAKREHYLRFDRDTFRAKYNKEGFLFRHDLADHPLLQLPKVAALALRTSPSDILHRAGKVPEAADFDHAHKLHAIPQSLERTLQNLHESGASVTINMPEKDPEYAPLIAGILREIQELREPLDPGLNWSAAYLFLSAPGSLTPYHMDREMNFLIHLRGRKTVKLWDPADPAVMTEAQVDRLFGRFDLPRPSYRPELDARARTFELTPGLGVHHPFIAPHLVYTGNEVAISLAITYRTDGSDRVSRLHLINHRLRMLGLRPKPVGASLRHDEAKLRINAMVGPLSRVAKRIRGRA